MHVGGPFTNAELLTLHGTKLNVSTQLSTTSQINELMTMKRHRGFQRLNHTLATELPLSTQA